MGHMFGFAVNFNQPLHNWNTKKVEYWSYMFYRSCNPEKIKKYIADWNVPIDADIFGL
jgi:hypothetical protein